MKSKIKSITTLLTIVYVVLQLPTWCFHNEFAKRPYRHEI